jgi:hypothetical protein
MAKMVTYTAKWGSFCLLDHTLPYPLPEQNRAGIFVGLMVCKGISSYFASFVEGVRGNIMCNSSLNDILCAMASYPKRRWLHLLIKSLKYQRENSPRFQCQSKAPWRGWKFLGELGANALSYMNSSSIHSSLMVHRLLLVGIPGRIGGQWAWLEGWKDHPSISPGKLVAVASL